MDDVFIVGGYEFPVTRPWRVGRSIGRTIYAQASDDAAKGDWVIGMMDSREIAEHVVKAVNAHTMLLQEIARLRQDAGEFQKEFDRINKALKDAAEAASSDFVDRLAAANRPSAPDRAALVEWLHEYHMYEYHQCERVADSMLASDLFVQEPATGTVSTPWGDPDDQPVTKDYVDSRQEIDRIENENARLQKDYDDLNTAFAALKKDRDHYKKWVDLNAAAYEESKRVDAESIKGLEVERDHFKEQVDQQSITIGNTRSEIEKLSKVVDDLSRERKKRDNRFYQEIRDLEVRNVELKAERDKALSDADGAIAQLRKVEDVNRQLVADNVAMEADRDEVLRETDEAENRGRRASDKVWERMLREQERFWKTDRAGYQTHIARLERELELARSASKQRVTADSVVNTLADIASVVAAGIRKSEER